MDALLIKNGVLKASEARRGPEANRAELAKTAKEEDLAREVKRV